MIILCIGAHPDDVEIGAGGTMAKMVREGHTVYILDLTRGEMGTRGSASLREEEAATAAEILGVQQRLNLSLGDSFFENNNHNQIELATYIRLLKPDWILTNPKSDRHPDHERSALLTIEANFKAGLRQITMEREGKQLAPHRASKILHYLGSRTVETNIFLDTTGYLDIKKQALLAYSSQFYDPNSSEPSTPISSAFFLENILFRDQQFAQESQSESVEAFYCEQPLVVSDISSIF